MPGNPDALVSFTRIEESSKFVEEVRLVSPAAQRLQWMLGGYYTKETSKDDQFFPPFTPSYAPLAPDLLLSYRGSGDYKEIAGFTNLTYKVSDLFDISGGARYSSYELSACIDQADGVFGIGVILGCSSLPSTGVSVWMGNARLHVNQDEMFYARVATGYRPGSGCPTCGVPAEGIPGIVKPDTTINYEVGFKGEFFDRRLQFEVSAFHINWKDIQITTLTPQGTAYAGNGGTAESNGSELTVGYLVTEGLRLNATVGFTDAHLTEDALAAGGQSGDQLPGSPRWTGSVTADYQRILDDHRSLLFGAAYRYRDAVVNQFAHTGEPLPLGPQNIADLYGGVVIRGITIRLFATNVFNNRSYNGLLDLADPSEATFVPIQPRTIGLSLDYRLPK